MHLNPGANSCYVVECWNLSISLFFSYFVLALPLMFFLYSRNLQTSSCQQPTSSQQEPALGVGGGGIQETFPGLMKYGINPASEQLSSFPCPCCRKLHSLQGAAQGGRHLFPQSKSQEILQFLGGIEVTEFSHLQWWRQGIKQPRFPITWL